MTANHPAAAGRTATTDHRNGLARRDRLALPGLVVATIGFLLAGVPEAALAVGLLALGWTVAPPIAVATLGAFLLAGTASASLPQAVSALGLALIVLVPARRSAAPWVAVLGTVGIALTLGAGVGWLAATQSLAIAAGSLLAAVALTGYSLHRYALVTVEQPSTAAEVSDRG